MSFCLPLKQAAEFINKLKDGTIDPVKVSEMTSAERTAFFSKIVGKDDAADVNRLFEDELSKNKQQGAINWVKQVTGIDDETRSDMIARINKNKLISPEDDKELIQDLKDKKAGRDITSNQIKKITELSTKAQATRAQGSGTPGNSPERIQFGNDLIDLDEYVESLKPNPTGFKYWAAQVLNIPRSALTSVLHFSASGVQLWGMESTKPFIKGFAEQFKYFADEQAYKDLNASILSHPDYPMLKTAGLQITKLGNILTEREEAIQSSLLEKIPVLGKWIKASNRAFTGMRNYVAFGRATDLLNAARLNGEDVHEGSSVVRDIAKVVNNFTGRGELGAYDKYKEIQPIVNGLFFSPRKYIATFEMFNPKNYLDPRISSTARIAALRQMTGSLIVTASLLELAHLSGASVNLNPTNTDFLKARFGKTTFDPSGGNAIYLRLLARLALNKTTSATGKTTQLGGSKYGSPTRMSLIESYLRDKGAPVAGAVADFLYNADPVGNPFSITEEMRDKLVPIVIQDYINLIENDPKNANAWIGSISAIFGVGMETTVPYKKTK